MKRLLLILLSIVLLATQVPVIARVECKENDWVMINDVNHELPNPIFIENKIFQFPLKDICNLLDINIQWKQYDNANNGGHYELIKDTNKINLAPKDRGPIPSTIDPNWIFVDTVTSIDQPVISEDVALKILGRFGYLFFVDEDLNTKIDNLNPINISVKNIPITYNTDLICYNNSPLLPLRTIFESLGATVTWDEKNEIAKVDLNNNNIIFNTREYYSMKINNEKIYLKTPMLIINSKTLIPIEALEVSLNYTVEWDKEKRSIYINEK